MKNGLYLTVILFMVDRISKEVMKRVLTLNKPYPQNSFFSLHLLYNYGGALSIDIPHFFLVFAGILVSFSLIFYVIKRKIFYYGIFFILAGTLGNLYDRIFYGYVIDFISFGEFPVFNLADSFISFGIFLSFLNMFKNKGGKLDVS